MDQFHADAFRPDLAVAICHKDAMPARRRRRRSSSRPSRAWPRRILLAVALMPLLYALAAIGGGLISVNRGWVEPAAGPTIYLASNGVHVDLVVPVSEQGVDWRDLVDPADARSVDPSVRWVAFGMGEKQIYLNTPTWRDLSLKTALHALSGGERVMHVEWVPDPGYASRQLRLSPAQYRRLAAAIAGGFARGPDRRPLLLDHPGYFDDDRFYAGVGRASAINTCNQWVADQLRLAGVRAPLWSPLAVALTRRYRPVPPPR